MKIVVSSYVIERVSLALCAVVITTAVGLELVKMVHPGLGGVLARIVD